MDIAARLDRMLVWLGLLLILVAARLARRRHRLLQRSQLVRASVIDLKPWTPRPRGPQVAVVRVPASDGSPRDVRLTNLVAPAEVTLGEEVYVALAPALSPSMVEEIWLVRWRHLFAMPRALLALGLFSAVVGLGMSDRPLHQLWTPALFSCAREHGFATETSDRGGSIDARWSCHASLADDPRPPVRPAQVLVAALVGLALASAIYFCGANGARRGDATLARRYRVG